MIKPDRRVPRIIGETQVEHANATVEHLEDGMFLAAKVFRVWDPIKSSSTSR